jgi:hypothetical protein
MVLTTSALVMRLLVWILEVNIVDVTVLHLDTCQLCTLSRKHYQHSNFLKMCRMNSSSKYCSWDCFASQHLPVIYHAHYQRTVNFPRCAGCLCEGERFPTDSIVRSLISHASTVFVLFVIMSFKFGYVWNFSSDWKFNFCSLCKDFLKRIDSIYTNLCFNGLRWRNNWVQRRCMSDQI